MGFKEIRDRLRGGRTAEQNEAADNRIESALKAKTRQFQSVDPATEAQWRRLQSLVVGNQAASIMPRNIRRRVASRPALAFGFALILLLVIGVLWLSRPSLRIYETGRGQQATIMLPDSTEVMLNHTSKLTVSRSFLERDRHVALQGEAYFNVRRNETPFVVSTDIGSVRVLGTEFNVQGREGQLEVGVVRGSVRVTCKNNGTDSSVVLLGDQIVACTTNGFKDKPSQVPFPNFPGWIHGTIMLYRTDLLSACRQLESQFGITITIHNQKLTRVTITGTLDGNNVDTALATLASLTGTNVRHENSGYILY